jgi:hypothetical protein
MGVILSVTRLATSVAWKQREMGHLWYHAKCGRSEKQHSHMMQCLAISHEPVDVLESAPMTTPPLKLAAMIVVPMDTGCGRAEHHGKYCEIHSCKEMSKCHVDLICDNTRLQAQNLCALR